MKILGISSEHDSGAALIVDGEVVAAVNEERYNRRKLATCFPEASIRFVLEESGVQPAQIDAVALASYMHIPERVWDWDQQTWIEDALFSLLRATGAERWLFGSDAGTRLVRAAHVALFLPLRVVRTRRMLEAFGIRAPLRVIDHHIAHLASAYYTSGWDRALALTVDASGDGLCSRVAVCEGGAMRLVNRIPFYHSPGLYYAAVNKVLGFKPGREGKVTGLAACGNSDALIDLFRSQIAYHSETFRFRNRGGYRSAQVKSLARAFRGHSREDVAAAVQRSLEETVCDYVRDSFARTGLGRGRLCLAGGVFANVRLNQKVAGLPEVGEIYVHPHMGDGGLAVGSALQLHARLQPDRTIPRRLRHAFLGPRISTDEIRACVERHGLPCRRVERPELEVARWLAAGKCIAWCRGRLEYGPRALCHRSILYQATDPTVNDWLNRQLSRSEFMPFAPVVREERFADYFVDDGTAARATEFMTITLDATERCLREAPAIVHVDNSARPQVVRQEIDPAMHAVLVEYERLTGLNVLINTSFNMHEEPIVCTAEDAVQAFLQSRLDALFMEDHLAHGPSGGF